MKARPSCPNCGAPVHRLQTSRTRAQGGTGLGSPVAAYGCGCWLTPDQARELVAAHRTTGDRDAA